jgi:hypothetical protein
MTHDGEPAMGANRINEQNFTECIRYKNRPEGFPLLGGNTKSSSLFDFWKGA